jgi:hypothetical protein
MHLYVNFIVYFALAVANGSCAYVLPSATTRWELLHDTHQDAHYELEDFKLMPRALAGPRTQEYIDTTRRPTPMSAADSEIITEAFAFARQLGVAMLRLGADDPRYQQGFGDFRGDLHSVVMRELLRL